MNHAGKLFVIDKHPPAFGQPPCIGARHGFADIGIRSVKDRQRPGHALALPSITSQTALMIA